MDFHDGLEEYQRDLDFYAWTMTIESQATEILAALESYPVNPPQENLANTKDFLIEIEKWKAGCYKKRMGNAISNKEQEVWDSFQQAYRAQNDRDRLLAIMQLIGFGSSEDETGIRPAKMASAVLRFLWPEAWGVVDWRTAALASPLDKSIWDVDDAVKKARLFSASEMRESFEKIGVDAVCEINEKYRAISGDYPDEMPRAADVDMALFGLSLIIWEMK